MYSSILKIRGKPKSQPYKKLTTQQILKIIIVVLVEFKLI